MKTIPFVKVVGTGNDFILIDGRKRPFRGRPDRFARKWCDRKNGVGADGLLLVIPSKKADARMRIFNLDGSEAEMCGNGLRCVAWYLSSQTVETGAGVMQTQVVGRERVRIFLPFPKNLRLRIPFLFRGSRYTIHSVNSGVPHTVLLTPEMEKMDLAALGPVIRYHRIFRPAGTNVNLMRVESPKKIFLRTYERGVEAETSACGTGSVAAVVIGTALGLLKPPVQVIPASTERLTVGFQSGNNFQKGVYLEGPARILFEGALPQ